MGARLFGNGEEKIYDAAQQWVQRGLLADDSLFTPGKAIWTPRWLGELRERFLDNPDAPGDGFFGKLGNQLAGSPPEVSQLMGEVMLVHYLIIHESGMKGNTKASNIANVLGWSPPWATVTGSIVASLSPGIARPGMYFMTNTPSGMGYIIELAERLKDRDINERTRILNDPWQFKSIAESLAFRGAILKNHSTYVQPQRDAIHFSRIRLSPLSLQLTKIRLSVPLKGTLRNQLATLTESCTRFAGRSNLGLGKISISTTNQFAECGKAETLLAIHLQRMRKWTTA